jgi:hypothetical protein
MIGLFLLFLTFNSRGDWIEDAADNNRFEFKVKFCDVASEMYSNYAKWVADNLENIYATSKPDTKQRDILLKQFKVKVDEEEDTNYIFRKKVKDDYKDNTSRGELIFQMLTSVHLNAYVLAAENSRLSKVSYQRKLEQDCKYSSNAK